ncbi:MAG: hypothetical protein EHM41_02690 [Chloroflexi bacterium]|nr:MAG: hypothetical protein EHM41_02690 [Chloroflexota bacterium]
MKILRKTFTIFALLVLILTASVDYGYAQEQEDELGLSLRKTFGYAAGGDMQGTFSIRASGPDTLTKVVFYMDGDLLAEDMEAPFAVSFATESYALGSHTFTAVGFTSTGSELPSREIVGNFVTAEQGWKDTLRLIIPLFVLIIAAMLLAGVVPALSKKKKLDHMAPGEERNYGFHGGSICPKCSRPFALHMFGLNLLTHKFDRCPYCGKWSFVRPLSIQKLREAERAEREMASKDGKIPTSSEEDKLLKELDNSRFTDI